MAAAQRVLAGGTWDWGPEVPSFEHELATWLGVGHAVGANSGMAAIKLALAAAGVGPGDEVITVPNSDIATTAAIHHLGATSVWVDVEWDTMNMDPRLAETAITPRTRVLLPVHLYGHPADMPALCALAKRHNLVVIEDACLALGAGVEGIAAGTWGEIGCFSHAPTKHLAACGTAGSAVTNDAALAERMRLYAGYGQPRATSMQRGLAGRGQHLLVEGFNERLDELQAAILRARLPFVAAAIAARRATAAAYSAALAGSAIETPIERPGYVHTFRNYVVRVGQRDRAQQRLAEAGIASALLYVPPLHLQPAYHARGYGRGAFPVTEAACDTLLALPIGPAVPDEQIERVVDVLRAEYA